MEKYRRFADSFTGKNPFLPVYLNQKKDKGKFLTHLLLGPILIAIKLPLLLILILVGLVYHLVIENLIVVPALRRKINLIFDGILFKIILIIFGVFSVQSSFRLGMKKQPKNFNQNIVLANHTSFLDLVYLQYLISPTFTRLSFNGQSSEENQQVFVERLGFLQVLKAIFFRDFLVSQDSNKNSASLDLSKALQKKGSLVLLYEGCNTNGNGILKMNTYLLEQILEIQKETKKELLAFNIVYKQKDFYSPINTIRSQFIHMLLMMTNITTQVKINAKIIQLPENGKLKDFEENFEGFYKSCGQTFLNLDYNNYKEFLDFWGKTKSKQTYIKEVKQEKIGQVYNTNM